MKLYTTILFTTLIALLACKSEQKEAETKASTKTEAYNTTTATLTAAQIKSVGIEFGNIEQKQLTATLKANGQLSVPNNYKANATSLYGGVIKTLQVQIGNYVNKGQVIATIANPQFIQLQEEYLNLIANKGNQQAISIAGNSAYGTLDLEKQLVIPQIDYAQKELNRQNELYVGNAGARKNLELAQSNLAMLKAKLASINQQLNIYKGTANTSNKVRLESVKKQLQLMGINIGSINATSLQSALVVTSPISGTVSHVFAKIGSYTDVSTPVVEIVDNGSLHVDLNVFEKDLPMLRVGQTIHFTLTNNAINEYDAEVYSIGTAFENDSKTIPVHATVKGNKTGLIDGMNITAIVSLNNVTAAAVPNDAIISHQGKDYIFVVTKAEKNGETSCIKSEIVKGVSNLGYTAITLVNEIEATSKVITKGAFFVNAKLTNVEEE